MYRKIVIGAVVGAAALGAGGAALATTGSTPASQTVASVEAAAAATNASDAVAPRLRRALLNRIAHGQVVVKDKDGKFVTKDIINGSVTAVSSSSITVKAADNTSQTYAVNGDTKVVLRKKDAKPAQGKIGDVATGNHVVVFADDATHTAQRIAVFAVK